jgi:hypothetical protein
VAKLIAGPGVYICDECIDLCNEIISEERAEPSPGGKPPPRRGGTDDLDRLAAALSFHANTLVDLSEQLHRALEPREPAGPPPDTPAGPPPGPPATPDPPATPGGDMP